MNFKSNIFILFICLFFVGCQGSNQRDNSDEKKSVAPIATELVSEENTNGTPDTLISGSDNKEGKTRITDDDGNWSEQNVALANTREAEWMLRAGDIDNLGFGWEEGFTPFSGKSTIRHSFPWETAKEDLPGTDRIIIPSGYNSSSVKCGVDGYTATTLRPDNNPRPITLMLTPLKSATIHSATLLIFVDDFQSPWHCSKFQVKLNGLRFIEMEKLLNALEQSGPVGKLINVKLPDEFLPLLKTDSLNLFIDDPVNSAGDGFAIDFVKLLINQKELLYKGNVEGIIIDKATRQPITSASAEIKGHAAATTDKQGKFSMNNITAGTNIITGSAPGYASEQLQADVIANQTREGIIIELSPSEKVTFENKPMQEGDELVMNNIQFELASANLTDTGKHELNKISAFMQQNVKVEILLSGHTSTDGTTAFNKQLSQDRVKTCKQYLVAKGIDEGRIEIIGYGSEKPVAPNNTELNRSKNRRVEMKITKL